MALCCGMYVGTVHLGDIHKRQVLIAAPFNFSRTEHTPAVGIDQDGNYLLRRVGVLTQALIRTFNRAGVQLLKNITIEIALMIIRQQIKYIAGK